MVSLTGLKACTVVPSNDILSLLRTAVFTENPHSATAVPCEIVRDTFAKRERRRNILQPVTGLLRKQQEVYIWYLNFHTCHTITNLATHTLLPVLQRNMERIGHESRVSDSCIILHDAIVYGTLGDTAGDCCSPMLLLISWLQLSK